MVKDKKSKLTKMDKLRRILDNPLDPDNKKLISKEERGLETIQRKLSKNKERLETIRDESLHLKPTIIIHEEENESKTKQFEETRKDRFKEDLIEVEKVESKPEFVEIKSVLEVEKTFPEKNLEKEEKYEQKKAEFIQIEEKEKPQVSSEEISDEDIPTVDKKLKIIDFKDVDEDEIYRRTKEGLLSTDKIQIYKPSTIFEIWVFTIIIGIVAISGLFLLRDWLFLNFHVYGYRLIYTPDGTQNIHIWFGFILAILGLFHIAIHILSKDRDILPTNTIQDFKSFLHSGLYLIGFARREDYKAYGRFSGRQRIVYIALVYIIGLASITGFLYYFNLLSEDLSLVHILPAGLSIMVLLFHFLITIRNQDIVALRCAFIDGKVPRWYARKKSPIWFKEIIKKRENILKKLPTLTTYQRNKLIEGKSKLNIAILKFALLLNENPDEGDIIEITNRIRTMVTPEELNRIIELAEKLGDEPEEENEPKGKDEEQPSDKELKEDEESSDN